MNIDIISCVMVWHLMISVTGEMSSSLDNYFQEYCETWFLSGNYITEWKQTSPCKVAHRYWGQFKPLSSNIYSLHKVCASCNPYLCFYMESLLSVVNTSMMQDTLSEGLAHSAVHNTWAEVHISHRVIVFVFYIKKIKCIWILGHKWIHMKKC